MISSTVLFTDTWDWKKGRRTLLVSVATAKLLIAFILFESCRRVRTTETKSELIRATCLLAPLLQIFTISFVFSTQQSWANFLCLPRPLRRENTFKSVYLYRRVIVFEGTLPSQDPLPKPTFGVPEELVFETLGGKLPPSISHVPLAEPQMVPLSEWVFGTAHCCSLPRSLNRHLDSKQDHSASCNPDHQPKVQEQILVQVWFTEDPPGSCAAAPHCV